MKHAKPFIIQNPAEHSGISESALENYTENNPHISKHMGPREVERQLGDVLQISERVAK